MTAVLLNGASSPADPAHALCAEVEPQLAARLDTVRTFHLAGYDIGHCIGEFDCFVKTPGRCRIHDEGQEIERAVHDAELVVLVTPLHYGGYAAQLKKQVEVVTATEFVRGAAVAQAAAQRCAQADLLLVISPLYWDSLPYVGLLALEHIHAARMQSGAGPARLVGVLNCGFAEPEQFRFAFGLLREFAQEAGCTWAGGLPVAGGEAINGRNLDRLGVLTRPLRHAIDIGMPALLAGSVLPEAACDAAAVQTTPGVLYRFFGRWGWHMKRLAQGLSAREVHAKPFDDLSDAEWERLAAAGPARARPLQVAGMLPEGADAVTVVFDDPARHAEHFRAGQVLTLEVTINGERVRRAYSLATAPCDASLAITVKRVPGGLMSNWIHDQLSQGDWVRCFGPSGDFTAGPPPAQGPRRLLLIAGGSGIVPLQAVARQVLHDKPDAAVTLVYGSHALERAIFAASLQQQALRDAPRWRLHWVFETAPLKPIEGTGPACTVGRLDAPTLTALLEGTDLRSFHRAMVCGPDAMRAAVRQALLAGGLPADPLFEESVVSPRRGAVSDQAQAAVFESADGERTVTLRPGDTLLEAALNAGIALPFSCCSGGCGACRVHVTDHLDQVVLDEPNAVTAEARSRGEVPACLVRLAGPCRFRLP